MAVRYKIKGLDKLKRDLKRAKTNVDRAFAEQLQIAAYEIQSRSVSGVPVDFGVLRNSINVEGSMFSWSVYASVFYAPYVEFGTGQFARNTMQTLPSDWQKHAAEFFVNGKGMQPAQPFFYPAVRAVQKTLQDEVDKAIQDELNKI